MTARRRVGRGKLKTRASSTSARACPLEHTEQAKLVARVRLYYPDALLAAVPNGARLSGGARAGAQLKDEGMLPGYPDLLVDEARGGYFGLRIEMKRQKGGRLSKAQRETLDALLERGYLALCCAGVEEAWRAFEDYIHMPPTLPTVRPARETEA